MEFRIQIRLGCASLRIIKLDIPFQPVDCLSINVHSHLMAFLHISNLKLLSLYCLFRLLKLILKPSHLILHQYNLFVLLVDSLDQPSIISLEIGNSIH